MSDPLEVSPDALKANGDALTDAGKMFKEVGDTVNNAIAALGEFWGADEFGSLFIKYFGPAINSLNQAAEKMGTGLGAAGDLQDLAAKTFTSTDERNAESLSGPEIDRAR